MDKEKTAPGSIDPYVTRLVPRAQDLKQQVATIDRKYKRTSTKGKHVLELALAQRDNVLAAYVVRNALRSKVVSRQDLLVHTGSPAPRKRSLWSRTLKRLTGPNGVVSFAAGDAGAGANWDAFQRLTELVQH